jgi:hypothetical protein
MTQPYGQDPGDPYRQPQQPYGQPQYGQPGYPPGDQRRAAVANAYGDPIGSGAKFGVVGATLAGVGGVLLIIAFTAVDWLSLGGSISFSDIHDRLAQNSTGSTGVADTYFSWLGWVLVVAVVVIAIAANLPSPASGPLRAFGAIVAAAAIALTFFAIQLSDGLAYSSFIKHAAAGFYLALGGFLLAGIGALIGPSRRI